MIGSDDIRRLWRRLIVPERHSLKIKSVRAAVWSLSGRGGRYVVRMCGSLVLTRLLFPEAFGLMATANVVLSMLQLFSDTGVRTAIIQNRCGARREFLNTAWIIAIGRGVLLFVVLLSLAFPASRFYGDARLVPLLATLSLVPLIGGFENPGLTLLVREFRTEKGVTFELATQIIGLTVTAALSAIFRSVFALAVGSVVTAALRLAGSYIVHPFRPQPRWHGESGTELVRFGRRIFVNTLVTWLALHADLLLVGRLLGMEEAGYYNLGQRLGALMPGICVAVFTQAFLPAASSVGDDRVRVSRMYRRTVALVLAVAVPAAMTLALFGTTVVQVLYDPRYAPASRAVTWLAAAGCVQLIGMTAGTTFIARGRVGWETVSMVTGAVLLLGVLPLAAAKGGLAAMAMAVGGSRLLVALFESLFLITVLNFPARVVWRPWLQATLVMGACGGMYACVRPLCREGWRNVPLALGFGLAAAAVSAAVYVGLEGRRPFRDLGGGAAAGEDAP